MSINIDKIIKITGIALSVTGTILTGIANDRDNKKVIEKLVKEAINK